MSEIYINGVLKCIAFFSSAQANARALHTGGKSEWELKSNEQTHTHTSTTQYICSHSHEEGVMRGV